MSSWIKTSLKTVALALPLLALGTLQAQAGARCYAPEEVRAEQLLRLHSELMVITVTCHQGSSGQDLVPAYTGFTQKNIGVLHEAESTMKSYYKKAYGSGETSHLDRLRTLLANEYGQQIAQDSAPAFCAQRRDKVLTLASADSGAIENETSSMLGAVRTLDPPCASLVKTAHRGR